MWKEIMNQDKNEFNNKHRTAVYPEHNEFRIICINESCGWVEKARTQDEADGRAKRHREFPARTMHI